MAIRLLVVVVVYVVVGATEYSKSLGPRRFKSDREDIWQDCCSKSTDCKASFFGQKLFFSGRSQQPKMKNASFLYLLKEQNSQSKTVYNLTLASCEYLGASDLV